MARTTLQGSKFQLPSGPFLLRRWWQRWLPWQESRTALACSEEGNCVPLQALPSPNSWEGIPSPATRVICNSQLGYGRRHLRADRAVSRRFNGHGLVARTRSHIGGQDPIERNCRKRDEKRCRKYRLFEENPLDKPWMSSKPSVS